MTTPPVITPANMPKKTEVLYNGPATPAAYIPGWGQYTNLTAAQVAWFQSQPADLLFYAMTKHAQAQLAAIAVSGKVGAATTLCTNSAGSLSYLQQLSAAAITIVNGITGGTVTTRAAIDGAIAAVPLPATSGTTQTSLK